MGAIDKNNILKIAKHAFKRSQGAADKRLMHPHREWGLGIIVFVGILLAGSLFTAGSFAQFRSLDTGSGNAGVTIPKYNQGIITTVLTEYQAREATFAALVAEVVTVPQPETATSTDGSASTTDTMIETNPEVIVDGLE